MPEKKTYDELVLANEHLVKWNENQCQTIAEQAAKIEALTREKTQLQNKLDCLHDQAVHVHRSLNKTTPIHAESTFVISLLTDLCIESTARALAAHHYQKDFDSICHAVFDVSGEHQAADVVKKIAEYRHAVKDESKHRTYIDLFHDSMNTLIKDMDALRDKHLGPVTEKNRDGDTAHVRQIAEALAAKLAHREANLAALWTQVYGVQQELYGRSTGSEFGGILYTIKELKRELAAEKKNAFDAHLSVCTQKTEVSSLKQHVQRLHFAIFGDSYNAHTEEEAYRKAIGARDKIEGMKFDDAVLKATKADKIIPRYLDMHIMIRKHLGLPGFDEPSTVEHHLEYISETSKEVDCALATRDDNESVMRRMRIDACNAMKDLRIGYVGEDTKDEALVERAIKEMRDKLRGCHAWLDEAKVAFGFQDLALCNMMRKIHDGVKCEKLQQVYADFVLEVRTTLEDKNGDEGVTDAKSLEDKLKKLSAHLRQYVNELKGRSIPNMYRHGRTLKELYTLIEIFGTAQGFESLSVTTPDSAISSLKSVITAIAEKRAHDTKTIRSIIESADKSLERLRDLHLRMPHTRNLG